MTRLEIGGHTAAAPGEIAGLDLPEVTTGVVCRAYEPDDSGTFELAQPVTYIGFKHGSQIFGWSLPDEHGFAWSLIVDVCPTGPVMRGVTVASETLARGAAELAYAAAVAEDEKAIESA